MFQRHVGEGRTNIVCDCVQRGGAARRVDLPVTVKPPPPPPFFYPTMATTSYYRDVRPHVPRKPFLKRAVQGFIRWVNTSGSCVPCGAIPDEWLDYELDEEMRQAVMEEICEPFETGEDEFKQLADDLVESDDEVEETSDTESIEGDQEQESTTIVPYGYDFSCGNMAVVPFGYDFGGDAEDDPEPPADDESNSSEDGTGLSCGRRRRLRVRARFVARMAMVLRARHGRLSNEPANHLVISNDYNRLLRKSEYGFRSVDVEAHRRDVLNTYFSDLPHERAPLVRSRLPRWFKDLMDVPDPATRPMVC